MSLLIIIPARGGSKRLPGKNLRPLAGRSLLAHTQEAISAAGLDAPILLTTDDDDIAAEGRRLGWLVPFRRPEDISGDASPTIAAVLHGLDWHKTSSGSDPAQVMVLQPTSPFRGSSCLTKSLEVLEQRPEIDSVIAMSELHVSANFVFAIDGDGSAAPIKPRDNMAAFVPNGALYLTRVAKLRKENSLYAGKTVPIVMTPSRSIDIDTEDDWRLAECLALKGVGDDEYRQPIAASGSGLQGEVA